MTTNSPISNVSDHRPLSATNELDPPHELPHTVLPPNHYTALSNASATDSIARQFSHAVELADQMGEISGYLATVAVPLLPFMCLLLLDTVSGFDGDWFSAIFGSLVVAGALLLVRLDFHGHRYNPILFNRALGQVHVMETEPLSIFEFLFMPWKMHGGVKVRSFAWNCTRAEVVTLPVFQGVVVRSEFNLVLAFTESPESNKVVYRAAAGTTTAYDNGQGCVARWEHLRQYMRGEGPAFRAGDRFWRSGATSFLQGLCYGQMLLGPGSGEFWRSKKTWVYIVGVITLPLMPFTAFHGLIKWACYAVRPAPKWPAEIQRSIGPALTAKEMRALEAGAGVEQAA